MHIEYKNQKDLPCKELYQLFLSVGWATEGETTQFMIDNFNMSFAKVYTLLIAKIEKKGRTRDEIDQITCWLTGYKKEELDNFLLSDMAYGDFFLNAPELNPNRKLITGKICGISVEKIEEPLMQEIRYLDKLVDELAKGKAMEKILRK